MESLTAEGRAIFDTISSNAEVNNERQKKEIGELIVRAVNAAMDSTIWANIDKVVAYRQLYADGVESMLHQHISELRKQIGFTTRSNEPESSKKCRRVTRRPAQMGAILLRLHGGRPCGLLPLHPASGKSNKVPLEDKLIVLKNYRRTKGLCFVYEERWIRDHKCQSTAQLHVVEELVDFCQQSIDDEATSEDGFVDMVLNMMHLDDLSKSESNPDQSIVLNCIVQVKSIVFLLYSSSNNSFLNASLADNFLVIGCYLLHVGEGCWWWNSALH